MSEKFMTAFTDATPWLMLFVGFVVAAAIDPYVEREDKKTLLRIFALVFTLVLQNIADYLLADGKYIELRLITSVYGYVARPVALLLLIRFVSPKVKQRLLWLLIGVNAAVYLSAFFSPVAISFTEKGNFKRGPLGYTCFIISYFLLLRFAILVFTEYRRIRLVEAVIPVGSSLLIILSTFMDLAAVDIWPVTALTSALISVTVFDYIWLHMQLVRKHEKTVIQEEKDRQRIRIMVSQIQPHFVYNTLSTIQGLCLKDPKKAAKTVERFATYMRQNIDSLSQPDLISFQKEMDHTKVYADIEMQRFSNISVSYDIGQEDFLIPALTIQPLVENAIRHGVRYRSEGLVKVSVRNGEDCHIIVVEDNGKGFETSELWNLDDSHIGLRNVIERVKKLCDGTVKVESIVGEGTTITIRIPRNKEEL